MDMFFGVTFLFWPVMIGLIAMKTTCIPNVLVATIVRGYIVLFISFVIAVSFMFLYYTPVSNCLSGLAEPLWSKCTALPIMPIEWFGEWNFVASNAIGITVVLLWLYKQQKFNKALKSDAERGGAV